MTQRSSSTQASNKLATSITVDNVTIPDVSVHMVRPPFSAMPLRSPTGSTFLSLPETYQFRTYRPGDQKAWTAIQQAAEQFLIIQDTLFDEQFGDELEQLPSRMYFIDWVDAEGNSTAVGTATAWWTDAWQLTIPQNPESIHLGSWGKVHWVAIHPAHQGKGLSKPLMHQVMSTIARHNDRAMLGTSTGRVPAIKVYLDLGFLPEPNELNNAGIKDAWHKLNQVLRHPALTASLE